MPFYLLVFIYLDLDLHLYFYIFVLRSYCNGQLKIYIDNCAIEINKIIIISNNNWTEWGTIQGVIARVVLKSDEREARGRFEITSTITP